MRFLPIFLNLAGKRCLVIGGGPVAARKAATLLRAGGTVTVLAPELGAAVAELLAQGRLAHCRKIFEPSDLAGFHLVVAASDQPQVNALAAEAAEARGIPVNVVDRPELCSFVFPAIVDRSPLLVAVSSGGAAPVLARLLRDRLERMLPAGYGALAELAGRFRARVKASLPQPARRRRFWERVLAGPVAQLVLAGRVPEAELHLEHAIQAEKREQDTGGNGFVFLVGAGPGDPDLLTLGGLRAIQEADVVVYDRLVSPEIMDLVRKDADRIYAGKEASRHTLPQDRINALLVKLAREGKRVVRLKGGDPFIFGRGGEEIDTLLEEGIPFQVVPGITAAAGCAAYAGIPLTHRDYAQSVSFVTGHLKEGESADLDWEHLARPRQTLVIYMGLKGLARICAQLMAHGLAPETPAALIEQGTTHRQRLVVGTVRDLPERVAKAGIGAPTLVIVGEVVNLHRKLAWFRGTPPAGADPTSPEA
ncbi:siroheme synthase [Candidatus Methylocalor cossyra]|uniref:Siroheme synthase n=2 Tax=Candidatus Methylocalor cossyra TaxID=3108543 RepID=A0ABP1C5X5_9GAMM